jgi:sugar phosphate isomerase/epimerase
MAGYTFKEFSVVQTIEMMKRIGVTNLSLKDFHMPLNSTAEKINAVINEFKSAGINIYTVGVIYMKSEQAVDQAFEYAKMAGVKMIVGAPDYNLLPYVEKKIKTYDFKLAIHNHGPDNPLFPNATDIWNHIKELDLRMGICIDIGHTTRDGQDPSEDIIRYKSRIYDVHIKDVDRNNQWAPLGEGTTPIDQILLWLDKVRFAGWVIIEEESDKARDNVAGAIKENRNYLKRLGY